MGIQSMIEKATAEYQKYLTELKVTAESEHAGHPYSFEKWMCKKYHFQDCDHCDDWKCGDNTNSRKKV